MEAKGQRATCVRVTAFIQHWVERWAIDIQIRAKAGVQQVLTRLDKHHLGTVFLCAGIGISPITPGREWRSSPWALQRASCYSTRRPDSEKAKSRELRGRSSRPAKTRNGKRGGRLSRYTERPKARLARKRFKPLTGYRRVLKTRERGQEFFKKRVLPEDPADADQRKRRLGQCDQRHGPGRAGR